MKNPFAKQAWTVRSILARAGEVLGEEGVRSLFFKVAGELCYRRLRISELRFDDVDPVATSGTWGEVSGNLAFVKLDRSGFGEYLAFRTDLDQREIDRRHGLGHECWAILIEGKLAQASWAATGASAWIEYLHCEIALRPGDVYIYEFLVHPDHRRRKLSPTALSRLICEYRQRGYQRIVWGWMPENTRVVSIVRHWPFRQLGTIGYLGVAGWRRYFGPAGLKLVQNKPD